MSRINIHRGTFLEKEELKRMLSFLENRSDVLAILSSSISYGIVSSGAVAGKPFSVTISETKNAIDIAGGYIVTSNNKVFELTNVSAFPIPMDNKFYWLKVTPSEYNYENGVVQIDVSGNVSGNVSFKGIVRSQSSGVATCIRFVKSDGSIPRNSYVYQVVDIVDDNNIVLSGGHVFVKESDLKVIVLGSIPMGGRFTDEQLEGLYTFTGVNVSLVQEQAVGQAPEKGADEFYIARIKNNGGDIVWNDERLEFWKLGVGGVPSLPTYEDFNVVSANGTYESYEVVDGVVKVVI